MGVKNTIQRTISSTVMLKLMRSKLSVLGSITTAVEMFVDRKAHSSAMNSTSMKVAAHRESTAPCVLDSVKSLQMSQRQGV
jgi:hypothetical protein